MDTIPYGFRIVGPTWEPRRLVDAAAALAGYAVCGDAAETHREAYLSAFQFGEDFRRLLLETGSTAGFSGKCWASWLWFDIDRAELPDALEAVRRLAANLGERYQFDDDALLAFFSGSKGFHIGLPTSLWAPEPSDVFHRVARRFAENAAERAGVTIDTGVYDRVRAFRAPNSRHPKTGLRKHRLTFDELMGLSLDAIFDRAKRPEPFDLPKPPTASDRAVADWQAAVDQVRQETEAKAVRRVAGVDSVRLNRATVEFIRRGADQGDRHRLLFSAAANLAEFGCPPVLAVALLEESGLDSGLPPKEVHRQVQCGLASAGSVSTSESAPELPQETRDDESYSKPVERNTGESRGLPGQSCQGLTRAPVPTQGELAALWERAESTATEPAMPSNTPAEPEPQLPPGGGVSGKLDTPCRCGSAEYVDVPIGGGRTRRDCRQCGRFLGWGKWNTEGDSEQ